MNGATGVSDMAGKAAQAAVERCGWQPRYNLSMTLQRRKKLDMLSAVQ
jgi:hypothetical protein